MGIKLSYYYYSTEVRRISERVVHMGLGTY